MPGRLLLFLGMLIMISLGYFMLRSSSRVTPSVSETVSAPASPTNPDETVQPRPVSENATADVQPPVPTHRPTSVRIRAGQAIPEIFPHQAERDIIQALVSKYEVRQVPEIASYLSHKDATVREAARLGLMQLGYSEAVPYLKAALIKASDEEAEQLQADIEFLSLPTAEIR